MAANRMYSLDGRLPGKPDMVNQGYDSSGIMGGVPNGGHNLNQVPQTVNGQAIARAPMPLTSSNPAVRPIGGNATTMTNQGYDSSGINPNGMYTNNPPVAGGVYPASSSTPINQLPASPQNPAFPVTAPNYMGPGPVLTPENQPNNWANMLTPIGSASDGPRINYTNPGTGQVDSSGAPRINYAGGGGNGVTGNYNAAQINWNGGVGYTNPGDHNAVVQASIDAISDKGGAYLTNATRRGLESAGARGVLNSSIASGAANRSAIEAMDPYVGQAVDLAKTREGFAYQSGENNLDRSLQVAVENGKMSNDMAQLLATHTFQGNQAEFDRTLQAALAQGQIDSSTYNLLKTQQFQGQQNSFDRGLQAALAQGQIDNSTYQMLSGQQFQGSQAALDRGLQAALQQGKIDSDTATQLRSMGFQSMQAGLDRTQQQQLQNQQYAFQGEQAGLDRDQKAQLQSDAAFQQDWLSSRNFSRDFQSQLSMIPLSAAADLTSYISKYAVENPDIYTPEIINGMSNFMAQNMASILNQYFPNQQSYSSGSQSGGVIPPNGTPPPVTPLGGNP